MEIVGRHPGCATKRPEYTGKVITLRASKAVEIQINDSNNEDYWLDITLTEEELRKMLAEIETVHGRP